MKQEIKERIELINKGIVPVGYKKTSVGICPVEWEVDIYNNLGKFSKGSGIPGYCMTDSGSPCVGYGDIYTKYNIKFNVVRCFTDELTAKESKKISKDTLLFTGSGETAKEIGKCVCYCGEEDIYAGGDIILFDAEKVNPLFLSYQQNLWPFIKEKARLGQGHSVVHIYPDDISRLHAIFPRTFVEQQKIAEILNCATRQVELQEQLVDKLKVQKKALMQRVFNGEYETISIQEALNKNYLREIKPKELQKYDGTKNYLSTSSIIQDEIVLIEDVVTYENRPSRAQMKPLENSVWFAKMTNSIKVIKANKDLEDGFILSTGFYGFLCDEINLNSDFLKQVFLSDYFNKTKDLYSEGSSQNGIKSNALEKLLIPFIELEKQLEIAEWLSFLDKNILLQQKLLWQYKLRQKALMQLLLTGIVRVN